jgi:hypothetical protein
MNTENRIPICTYNEGVECQNRNCETCGWYPPVAELRLLAVMGMRRYRIPFTGYCEVWAESPEEAVEKAEREQMYTTIYKFSNPECLVKEE